MSRFSLITLGFARAITAHKRVCRARTMCGNLALAGVLLQSILTRFEVAFFFWFGFLLLSWFTFVLDVSIHFGAGRARECPYRVATAIVRRKRVDFEQ